MSTWFRADQATTPSRGCNRLIAQGSGIFSSVRQVLEEQGVFCENIKKKEKNRLGLQQSYKGWCIVVSIYVQKSVQYPE